MTDLAETGPRAATSSAAKPYYQSPAYARLLKRRYAAERNFKIAGCGSIAVAAVMLVVLLGSIVGQGYTAFWQTRIQLEVMVDPAQTVPVGTTDRATIARGDFNKLVRDALLAQFPDVTERSERRKAFEVLSGGAGYELADMVMNDPTLIGRKATLWVTASDDVDQLMKGYIDRNADEANRKVNDIQLRVVDKLLADKNIELQFNDTLFTRGDSREPELAGLWGSIKGSVLTLMVTLCLSLPIGVAAAIYLEEFAPKNKLTDFIEVNINNLAAVPSIVYGLLGLAVFLNFFGMPRSAPVVGGVVLALMTLPIIIIASRAALKAVLEGLTAVTPAQFAAFGKPQQMAFLINAYNAFTIELILTEYPKLKSIKDLGSIITSPWKKPFYRLLGGERHLDWIEHEQLRPKYQDPRIHAAIVCASIGCPALRPEAFTAERLEAQLEDGMQRFLGDRTRNRASADKLEVSSIFKWFREDFEKGHQGFNRVEDVFARYAAQLSADPAVQEQLRARKLTPTFLDYDWSLNDAGR